MNVYISQDADGQVKLWEKKPVCVGRTGKGTGNWQASKKNEGSGKAVVVPQAWADKLAESVELAPGKCKRVGLS